MKEIANIWCEVGLKDICQYTSRSCECEHGGEYVS